MRTLNADGSAYGRERQSYDAMLAEVGPGHHVENSCAATGTRWQSQPRSIQYSSVYASWLRISFSSATRKRGRGCGHLGVRIVVRRSQGRICRESSPPTLGGKSAKGPITLHSEEHLASSDRGIVIL